MRASLDKVNRLIEELSKLKPIKSEYQQKLNKKIRLEFNYNSNHIEGNTLTYDETKLLLLFDDTKGNHLMREYEEMKSHDAAYHMISEWAKDLERPLTEQAIKNLNEIILVRPFWKDAITSDGQKTRRQIKVGSYKEQPNSVILQNGELFDYASPTDTPILMNELLEWYKKEEEALHPVTLAAMLHYKFVCIHPFDDGNGRISRLLMNYVLLKNNLPPVIIKSSEKNYYLNALHLADTGNYEAFIGYIAEQLIWSLELYIKGAKGESIDEKGDLDKKLKVFDQLISKRSDYVTVKKTIETQQKIISNIFIPFLNELGSYNSKLSTYFFDNYYQFNTRIIFAGDPISKLSDLILDLTEYTTTTNFEKVYILFVLEQFKLADRKFDVEMLMTVELLELKYIITVAIGLGGTVSPTDKLMFLNSELKISNVNNNIEYVIFEGFYHTYPSIDQIQSKAEKVGTDLFSYIEKESLKE